MRNIDALIPLLAALYHESSRPSVAAGDTLAHAVRQARPFTQWGDLRVAAQRGRELTAQHLLAQFDFRVRRGIGRASDDAVEHLAQAIHEAERDAVERGWTVVKLDPPRPWMPWAELPAPAQEGRRRQARYLLERFDVRSVEQAA